MDLVTQNSQFMIGASCFAGTRVPVATLFDNLNDCTTFTQVIWRFSGFSVEQIKAVLQQAADAMQKRATY